MAFLYERAGRLAALFDGFGPGQWAVEEYAISCDAEAARRGTFDGGVQPAVGGEAILLQATLLG